MYGSIHKLRNQLPGKGGSQMFMLGYMERVGVDDKFTDYVDMGWGLQKFYLFFFKSEICFTFSDKIFILLIY